MRAVAVTALALPMRKASATIERAERGLGAPEIHGREPEDCRRAVGRRLRCDCSRSRPPEILLWGARVSHDVKCFSVRQRLMSMPISESSR